jgi:magnesium transporter
MNQEATTPASPSPATPPGARKRRLPRPRKASKPGAVPGIDLEQLSRMPSGTEAVRVICIDYGPDQVHAQEVADIAAFVASHRPAWATVRWINVDGLTDMGAIRAFAEKYRLHPLAIEDVLHVTHRPKVEAYAEGNGYQARLFIIARMLELQAGDVLLLDTDEGKPLPVIVQGREKLHGTPTISGGSMAVQVEGPLAPPSRTPTNLVH